MTTHDDTVGERFRVRPRVRQLKKVAFAKFLRYTSFSRSRSFTYQIPGWLADRYQRVLLDPTAVDITQLCLRIVGVSQ